jgi:hypothetical protein
VRARDSYQSEGAFGNSTDYQMVFIQRAHRLLGLGYARLTPSEYSDAEEPEITGELVDAIEDVFDDITIPEEITEFLSVHENPPERDGIRKGKHRRMLDIRIDCEEHRPRARLLFEAKCLGPEHGVGIYLGSDGLGRFVEGQYAKDARCAGMIGYVQAGKPEEWGAKIDAKISKKCDLLLLDSSPWRKEEIVKELSHTYRSGHSRPNGIPIEIFHCLLLFN